MADLKCSVVMPHFNQSHLISNAINSIRNQTIEDWELIIMDDGSDEPHTNKLSEIILKFDDARIQLILTGSHGGLVNARNRGCQFVKSDIIVTQDADDLSLPDRLEKCLHAIKFADVVYHGAYINMWDKQFECIGRKYLPAKSFNKFELLKGQYITGWPAFRKVVWNTRPFRMETQFAYDWMMYLDWAWRGFRFKALNEGLYEYVRHENSASITFERDGRRAQSMAKIREIMLNEYNQEVKIS